MNTRRDQQRPRNGVPSQREVDPEFAAMRRRRPLLLAGLLVIGGLCGLMAGLYTATAHSASPESSSSAQSGKAERSQTRPDNVLVDPERIALHNVAINTEQAIQFSVNNMSEAKIVILDARGSCGCSRVEVERGPLKAGASTDVMAYIKSGSERDVTRTVTVDLLLEIGHEQFTYPVRISLTTGGTSES